MRSSGDEEIGGYDNAGGGDSPSSHTKENTYFWNKERLYIDEWRTPLIPIPLWRGIATIVLIFTFALGCSWISTLCTEGSKFICVICLLACCFYFGWAIWWDTSYAVPPTWTFIKLQGFNPVWVIIWLLYNTMLIGFAAFMVVVTLVINFADLQEIFQWECWGDNAPSNA